MSDKVNCQAYEIDYKKVVQEITETLYKREEDLENKLKDEKNPIRYIEFKAIIDDVKCLRNCIYGMFDYCRKPVDVEVKKDE